MLWIPFKYHNRQTMVPSIVKLNLFFTVLMYFLGEILFITKLKLSLDGLLQSNQNNDVLEYSLLI